MKRTTLCLILAAVLGGAGCIAPKHNVYPVQKNQKLDKQGVFYALPRTVLTVEIPVTRTTYQAGPYIGYAAANGIEVPEPLRMKALAGSEVKAWEELRSVDMDFFEKLEPIQEEIRLLESGINQPPAKAEQKESANAEKEGLKRQLTKLKEDNREPVRLAQAVTRLYLDYDKISTKSFKLGAPEFKTQGEPDPNQVYLVEIRSGWTQDRELLMELSEMGLLTVGDSHGYDRTAEFVVTSIEAVAKTVAATIGVGGGVKTTLAPSAHQLQLVRAAQAKNIADEIAGVRGRRLDLISGRTGGLVEVAPDVLTRLLAELDKTEEELMANFWSKSTKAAKIVYSCTPKASDTEQILFYLDAENGVYPEVSDDGPVVFIPDEGSFRAPNRSGKPVKLSVRRQPDQQFPQIVKDARVGAQFTTEHGFRYRIPALAEAEVTLDGKPLGQTRTLIAQFGVVDCLPAGLRSIDSRIVAKFYEASGALKSVEVKTKSLDPALVGKLGSAGETLAKAYAARSAAESEKPSRLKAYTERLKEFQDLVKTAGVMGIPVPAWALDAAGDEGGDENGGGE